MCRWSRKEVEWNWNWSIRHADKLSGNRLLAAAGQPEKRLPFNLLSAQAVPPGSPSRGGEVSVYVPDINQPSLPSPFYSVLVSISAFYCPFTCISFHRFSRDRSPPPPPTHVKSLHFQGPRTFTFIYPLTTRVVGAPQISSPSVPLTDCNSHSEFTQSQKSATFYQNAFLRVAYPYVRNDVTVEKPRHVCCKQPYHVKAERFLYKFHILAVLYFFLFYHTTLCWTFLQQRRKFWDWAPKIAYLCNVWKPLAWETRRLLNNTQWYHMKDEGSPYIASFIVCSE